MNDYNTRGMLNDMTVRYTQLLLQRSLFQEKASYNTRIIIIIIDDIEGSTSDTVFMQIKLN